MIPGDLVRVQKRTWVWRSPDEIDDEAFITAQDGVGVIVATDEDRWNFVVLADGMGWIVTYDLELFSNSIHER